MTAGGKGAVVLRYERVKDALVDRVVRSRQQLANAVGDVAIGQQRNTPAERAAQYLPDYYHIGLSRGPLARQYWDALLAEHGPKEYAAFGREMADLMHGPHWAQAVLAAPPQVAAQGRWLRQQGLGPQPPQPQPPQAAPAGLPRIPSLRMGGG